MKSSEKKHSTRRHKRTESQKDKINGIDTIGNKSKKLMTMTNLAFVFILLIAIAFISFSYSDDSGNVDAIQKNRVYGNDMVTMDFFYLSTCPHCREQEKFNAKLLIKYPYLKIVSHNYLGEESRELLLKMATGMSGFDPENIHVPTTIVGDSLNIGYSSEFTTGKILENMIEKEHKRILENGSGNATLKINDLG